MNDRRKLAYNLNGRIKNRTHNERMPGKRVHFDMRFRCSALLSDGKPA